MPKQDPFLPAFFAGTEKPKADQPDPALPQPFRTPAPKPPAPKPLAPKPGPAAPDEVLGLWQTWRAHPSPEAAGSLLRKLDPTLKKIVSAHVGAASPVVYGQAKQMALSALERFDPSKETKISTFLHSQLQGLKRYQRRQLQSLKTSERLAIQSGQLSQVENELEGELGRPPSEQEVAHRMEIPLSHLSRLRRQVRGEVAEGKFVHRAGDDAGDTPLAVMATARSLWPELVYADLDPTNQFILEHTVGLFGKKKLTNAEIARRLRISPGAVSQRKSTIQALLDREQDLSPFLGD